METTRLIFRLSRPPKYLFSLNVTSRRFESSFQRNKSRLNVKPDSSFLLTSDSPQQDHIIFNPPASAPSVFHTPLKFLPPNDKRINLLAATAKRLGLSQVKLPPPMRPREVDIPRGHLNEADIAEIQRLNNEDPNVWTNKKLARKFNCSSEFISVCLRHAGGDPTARKAEMKAKWEYIESRWGPRRKKAREERQKRWAIALRDG
ncbi:putative 60s ribosomal protein [Golovinomyces cichoracearum]|uniref:Putative 60s ribosomal protein n=1 Tax=Golovinomyces cichoracearum TaxID=62708 RepID=A0A420H9D8_9PEZI|nr:putative 60s ribosomal protein [Golovinomyces cichoracearum]